MPNPDDIHLMKTDPLKVRARCYDLVLNGWELGSGSVRISDAAIQAQVFSSLGISDEEAESRFGFLMGAFKYGAPPHAGFAFGIDRLVAIFAGEENIREVIAYPKTQSGADLMTGAPKNISERQLRDLRIKPAIKG
jgi:aspartyl-tRNA synthetase